MKYFNLLFIVLSSLNAFSQIPSDYYDDAVGLTGYVLKSELHSIISAGHDNQGYGALYYGYETTDTDHYYENDGSVLDMYSEKPTATDSYNYEHGENTCGTYSDESDCYNREHIVPQSVFGEANPMKADIHFVVPSDGYVNNRRSSYAFGEVSSASWTSTNGSKVGSNSYPGYSGTVFEPIDEFKGDIARMLFYFATRYETQVDSWSHPMFNGTEDQVFADWFLAMILEWHANDPVSPREIDRNQACYNFQGNANPFIDHPEWVNSIWNATPDTENPSAPSGLSASAISVNSVDLSWNAATDDIGVFGYDIYQNSDLLASTSELTYHVSGLSSATSYNFYVIAKDAANNMSTPSNTVSITTLDTPYYILYEDFNNCDTVSDNFISFNEASDKNWECKTSFGHENTGCYSINGYTEDVASKDWLISTNSINFNYYADEKLSLYLNYAYGTTELELLYSNDYDGSGDPTSSTWISVPNIEIDTPSGTSSVQVQEFTDVDISGITGSAYLAFKYYSNGSPTRWNVDNFFLSTTSEVSVPDISNDITINLYPNPFHSKILVHANEPIKSIEIFNLLGQIVVQQNIDATSTTLDLSKLSSGSYFLKASINNSTKTMKIVKN